MEDPALDLELLRIPTGFLVVGSEQFHHLAVESRSVALLKPETGPFVVDRYGLGSEPAQSGRAHEAFGNSSMISRASSERWTS